MERDFVIPELFQLVIKKFDEAHEQHSKNPGYPHLQFSRDNDGNPIVTFAVTANYQNRIYSGQGDTVVFTLPSLFYGEEKGTTIALDLDTDRKFSVGRYGADRLTYRWWEVTDAGKEEFGDMNVFWPDDTLGALLSRLSVPGSYKPCPIVQVRRA